MFKKRKEMNGKLIKSALQNRQQNKSMRQTAKELGVDHTTVGKWLRKAEKVGLNWEKAKQLTDEQIHNIFSQKKGPKGKGKFAIDLASYAKRLKDREFFSIEDCWESYQKQASEAGAQAMCRSTFFVRLSSFLQSEAPVSEKLEMPQPWYPGEYMAIDFVGDSLRWTTTEGEVQTARIFVSVLPWSRIIYACVVKDAKTQSWINGVLGSFEYFGGCPKYILMDNDVALVKKAQRGSQELVKEFQDCLEYYGVEPSLARVRHPRDKGVCEGAVYLVEKAFIRKIRPGTIKCFEDAVLLCQGAVEQINQAQMKQKGISRKELFEKYEKQSLGILKRPPFTSGIIRKKCKVKSTGCIVIDGHQYSVPWRFVGAEVLAVLKPERRLEIYDINMANLLSEFPLYSKGKPDEIEGFTHIRPEHRHPSHADEEQRYRNMRDKLIEFGGDIAPFVQWFCQENRRKSKSMLAQQLGILFKLRRDFDPATVEAGCRHALEIGKPHIKIVAAYVETAGQLRRFEPAEPNYDGYLRTLGEFEAAQINKRTLQ